MVDTFYSAVRKDVILGGIFNGAIRENWPEHLDKMYRFWQTVLFHETAYRGNPLVHHINLPVSEAHFERWLFLFHKTIDENFVGPIADEAKWRAVKIADMFQHKIAQHRNRDPRPLA